MLTNRWLKIDENLEEILSPEVKIKGYSSDKLLDGDANKKMTGRGDTSKTTNQYFFCSASLLKEKDIYCQNNRGMA